MLKRADWFGVCVAKAAPMRVARHVGGTTGIAVCLDERAKR
jgi:hypothetical protein